MESHACGVWVHVLVQEGWQRLLGGVLPSVPELVDVKLNGVGVGVAQAVVARREQELLSVVHGGGAGPVLAPLHARVRELLQRLRACVQGGSALPGPR